jgi:tryptophanyl-tRNA synthetase
MSKSDADINSSIYLSDTNDQILKKLKRAVTDSGTEIALSDDKPGVKNLLTIQSALTGKPLAEIVASYTGKQYGHLKLETAEIITSKIAPVRDRASQLMKDRGELDRILADGAQKARERAQKTVDEVYKRVGFIAKR